MKKKKFISYLLSLFKEKRKNRSIKILLSKEGIDELKLRLNNLMTIEKPYLHKGYRLKNMADDLHIPVYQLSAFINQIMGMHFTDYINKFRISYCENLLKTSPAIKTTLKELSTLCGFSNRNSFTAAFKKFTNQKPSAYVKRYRG